jgi:hypothetical protein
VQPSTTVAPSTTAPTTTQSCDTINDRVDIWEGLACLMAMQIWAS